MSESVESPTPWSDDERREFLEVAGELRMLARKLRDNEISFDQAIYEELRLTVAFQWLPLLRRTL